MAIGRGAPRQFQFQPGGERTVFLREVGAILESDPGDLETTAVLSKELGVDEMELFELVQIAEDVWRVRLNPDPMMPADFAGMVRRFPTLEAIIAAAHGESRRTRA